MFSQFLFYINVAALSCLDPNGNNVCPKFVSLEVNSKNVNDFRSQCCPDFYEQNNTCQPCPAGTYGNKCEEQCPSKYYGIQCKEMCNCSYGYMCYSVQGCIRNNTRHTTGPGGVSEPQKNMLNNDIGTMTAASVSNPPEGDSTLSHIQIYLICVSSTMVLILIAAASVRIAHSACKTNGRKSHHSNRKQSQRTTSTRAVPNDIELRRLPRAPSSVDNPMLPQRSQYQLIEV